MSFFDVRIPEPPWERHVERPEWAGPPRGWLPGYSTQRAVLFRTDDTLLVVHRFLAYPTGVEFTVSLYLREETYDTHDIPWELHRPARDGELPDEFLRSWLMLSDGSKWTNIDWRHPSHDEEDVSGPVILGRGGKGGADSWEMDYWLWPLPPEGSIRFVASWPVRGIEETATEVDGGEIRARSTEADTVWEP